MKNQCIKYNSKGEAYITYRNRRHYLGDFVRFEPQLSIYFHGYKTMSNSHCLLIRLSDCGEAAKVTTT